MKGLEVIVTAQLTAGVSDIPVDTKRIFKVTKILIRKKDYIVILRRFKYRANFILDIVIVIEV